MTTSWDHGNSSGDFSDGNHKLTDRARYIVTVIVLFGALLRLGLYITNRADNAYDDHWTPVSTVLEGGPIIPRVDACWECGQPPLFTILATGLYKATHDIVDPGGPLYSMDMLKVLQGLTCLFGLVAVFAFLPGIRRAHFHTAGIVAAVFFVALMPRHIYLSAMMANDTLAVFVAMAATSLLMAYSPKNRPGIGQTIILGCVAGLCAFTKGTSLIVIPAVGVWLVWWGIKTRDAGFLIRHGCTFAICTTLFGGWIFIQRWLEYGNPLIKNMEIFGLEQEPGYIGLVSFLPKPITLMRIPFLDIATGISIPTQVYARIWFDYELYLAGLAERSQSLFWARFMYVAGFVPTVIIIVGMYTFIRDVRRDPRWGAMFVLIASGCFIVISHSIQYPVYSSMKATYLLPSLGAMGIAFGRGYDLVQTRSPMWLRKSVFIACVVCIVGIVSHLVWLMAAGPGHHGL